MTVALTGILIYGYLAIAAGGLLLNCLMQGTF